MSQFVISLLLCLFSVSCHRAVGDSDDAWVEARGNEVDTLAFRQKNHFGVGDFFVLSKPLLLQEALTVIEEENFNISLVKLNEGTSVAVMGVKRIYVADSSKICLHLGGDEGVGWTTKEKFLEAAVPDSPISKILHYLRGRVFFIAAILFVIAVMLYTIRYCRKLSTPFVHFKDVNSFYPTLVCLAVSFLAVLYESIQMFEPHVWLSYYFSPTLNPFHEGLSLSVSLFVASVWSVLILVIATIDDLFHLHDFSKVSAYFAGLLCICCGLYITFTLLTKIYVGYPLLLAYALGAFYRHHQYAHSHYQCLTCGQRLIHEDTCPSCGRKVTIKDKKFNH